MRRARNKPGWKDGGIPCRSCQPGLYSKFRDARPLLGKVVDRMLAEKIGVSVNLIFRWRQRFKIKPRRRWSPELAAMKKEIIRLVKKGFSKTDVARRFAISAERVRQVVMDHEMRK